MLGNTSPTKRATFSYQTGNLAPKPTNSGDSSAGPRTPTSKYAIALYEMVQLRSGLEKCLETVSIGRFRELVSVPPGQYERVDNLVSKVINPAVLQVNGLSDMSVLIEGRRKHARAGVDRFDIAWWRKSPEEMAAAVRERNRSKVGRMARLKGAVETAKPRLEALT